MVKYLKFFTWLDQPTIAALAEAAATRPDEREAQRMLAREVTTLVHGAPETASAERASAVLFGSSLADATAEEILTVFDDVPSVEVARAHLRAAWPRLSWWSRAGLAASKGEAAGSSSKAGSMSTISG